MKTLGWGWATTEKKGDDCSLNHHSFSHVVLVIVQAEAEKERRQLGLSGNHEGAVCDQKKKKSLFAGSKPDTSARFSHYLHTVKTVYFDPPSSVT